MYMADLVQETLVRSANELNFTSATVYIWDSHLRLSTRGGEDCPTFRLGIPTSGCIPVENFYSELRNPDFAVQMSGVWTSELQGPRI